MIDIKQAQQTVLAKVAPGPVIEVPLADALFRTLAEAVVCDVDQPPFDRSVMDGYAVRAADTSNAPVTLRVVGRVPAGVGGRKRLTTGEAMQINTGAPIPPGADAVVRVELTKRSANGETVIIQEAVAAGQFVTRRATYAKAGSIVLRPGVVLTPVNLGVAATVGASRIKVYRQPTVSILTTGDELVDIDQRPSTAQIRNSNQHLLLALVSAAYAQPNVLSHVRDDRLELRTRIRDGLTADVLCTTGGISMGEFDFVPEVLKELGATFHVHKISIKPGRPTIFATLPDEKLVFALPGNPVSALVGFQLLVRPTLAALQGRSHELPQPIRAILRGALPATANRQSYLPARMEITQEGSIEARVLQWYGSGDAVNLATANALIVRAPNSPTVEEGAPVSTISLD